MFRMLFCLISSLVAAGSAFSQDQPPASPVQLTTCELENHPNLHEKQMVELTGRVYIGKFDFFIDGTCTPHGGAAVSLDIGGDIPSPWDYWGIYGSLEKRKASMFACGASPFPLCATPCSISS
jgi:hypothetical protein